MGNKYTSFNMNITVALFFVFLERGVISSMEIEFVIGLVLLCEFCVFLTIFLRISPSNVHQSTMNYCTMYGSISRFGW